MALRGRLGPLDFLASPDFKDLQGTLVRQVPSDRLDRLGQLVRLGHQDQLEHLDQRAIQAALARQDRKVHKELRDLRD